MIKLPCGRKNLVQLRNANILRASLLSRTCFLGIRRLIMNFRPKRKRTDSDSRVWGLKKNDS